MISSRTQIGVLAVAAVLFVGACGGTDNADSEPELASIATTTVAPEDPNTAVEPTAAPEVDQDEAFARFEACMADYGVTVSIGAAGAGGAAVPGDAPDDTPTEPVTPEKMEQAQRECDPILDEAFGSFDLDPEQEAEMADQMLALQRCLTDDGYDIEIKGNSFNPGQVDMDEFGAALNRCSQEVGLVSGDGSGS